TSFSLDPEHLRRDGARITELKDVIECFKKHNNVEKAYKALTSGDWARHCFIHKTKAFNEGFDGQQVFVSLRMFASESRFEIFPNTHYSSEQNRAKMEMSISGFHFHFSLYFSMYSTHKNCAQLWLRLTAFVNQVQMCSPIFLSGQDTACVKYGNGFCGETNEFCECCTCERYTAVYEWYTHILQYMNDFILIFTLVIILINRGFSNLSCTFCMSPSSNTPDSTHQLISIETAQPELGVSDKEDMFENP
uniref:Uncharacterized protein n=1 Tax=Sinocyclocheilus rhinocerous TaxID=307959 RepID=A0A673G0Q5_9TELE